MRIWSAVIVDDQRAAIDNLLELLSDIAYIEVVATFVNERDAQRYLHVNQVDFLILDVELLNTDAFSFLQGLANPRIPTILYTGFEKYEDQGYTMDLVDVLLKPVSKSRLMGALRRVNNELQKNLSADEDDLYGGYEFFQVKGPLRYERKMVWFRDIVYIDTAASKVRIHLVCGKILESNATFKQIVERLPQKWFKQCIQNVAFNINFYQKYAGRKVVLNLLRKKKKREGDNVTMVEQYVTVPVGAKDIYLDFYKFLDNNAV
ncbi:LytR/AlgR family response regulator transcription factor [Sphingobacterium faecale]|uniref:Response regulator transcription factor n=1 Tax=Sphingobacterium faecale TaxID=2803775 RepID=A0ABS1R063_9SPHI|nr:LytTR family DNA-binding domain-containing protein [Sphingobacterium faecale]MBL1407649.1 response regulator transcription factor [Sphingobacterium faecale]